MFNKAEKVFAGILLLVCTVVAIVGYSAQSPPGEPDKIWFDASGGDVIFDHAYHVTLAECYDCHHNFEGDEAPGPNEAKCRSCHYYGEARDLESGDPTHPRFIGANCVDCHKTVRMEVVCDRCHIRPGFAFEESGRDMPPLPEVVQFETDNGPVTFDHKVHISRDVGEPCMACHHECKEGRLMKGMPCDKKCRACHYDKADQISECEDEYHTRYIGANCVSCHGADDCSQCHME